MNNFDKIRNWAAARNIIKGATPVSQFAKLVSEHGELAGHMQEFAAAKPPADVDAMDHYQQQLADLRDLMVDDIGDSLVVLTIIGAQLNIAIEDIAPDSLVKGSEFLSLTQAIGKVGDAVLKNDIESFKEMVSTMFALYSVMALDLRSSIDDCMAAAYEDIKDRKGVMYNGTFIKSTDERYAVAMKELGLEA